MIYHETTRQERLELALGYALNILSRNEPGDSRAVSDEFVSMASILCDHDNQEALDILTRSAVLESNAEKLYKAYIRQEELTSTIHSNRWAVAWSELGEATKQMWRDMARKEV
jgi:hypothetical protein